MSSLNLYVIVDKVSGIHVSNPIPALNDGVALNGFVQFLKGEEDKGLNKAMYRLERVGEFMEDGTIRSEGSQPVHVGEGSSAEEAFREWCEVELAREAMED